MNETHLNGYATSTLLLELINLRRFFTTLGEIAEEKNTTVKKEWIKFWENTYYETDFEKIEPEISELFVKFDENTLKKINALIVELYIKLKEYESKA